MAGPEGRKERKVVTVLFADLVGFTSRAETLDPYHARLRAELERFAGTVEKFIGDAVVALAGRGLAAASVAISPAPFRGVLPLPISALRSASPVLRDPGNRQVRVPIRLGHGLGTLTPTSS